MSTPSALSALSEPTARTTIKGDERYAIRVKLVHFARDECGAFAPCACPDRPREREKKHHLTDVVV